MIKIINETESAIPCNATSAGGIDGIGSPQSARPEPGVILRKKHKVLPFRMFLRNNKSKG